MRQPKTILGARAPLFDRLVDSDPASLQERSPHRVLNAAGLRASVARELARLLNTRCPASEDRNGTVIDYGIPSLSHFSASSDSDRDALATIMKRKIEAFEPRLRNVRVFLERNPGSPSGLTGVIEASLVTESLSEAVSFPLVLHGRDGEITVSDSMAAAR